MPPVGLMPFSVGDGAAALDDGVVVVVVVVVDGACSPLLAQATEKPPIATNAQPPATAIRRRLFRLIVTIPVPFVRRYLLR